MQNTSKYWTSSMYVDLMICEGEKVNKNSTGISVGISAVVGIVNVVG